VADWLAVIIICSGHHIEVDKLNIFALAADMIQNIFRTNST
jgi:hypothetical protein